MNNEEIKRNKEKLKHITEDIAKMKSEGDRDLENLKIRLEKTEEKYLI